MGKIRNPSCSTEKAVAARAKRNGVAVMGFSLAEVMIATALLGIIFAGVFSSMNQTRKFVRANQLRAAANMLVESEAEYCRSLDWISIEALAEESEFTTVPVNPLLSTKREIKSLDDYHRSLRLSVFWTDETGKTQKISVITVITQAGITS